MPGWAWGPVCWGEPCRELGTLTLHLLLPNVPAVAGAELIKQAGGVPFEAACVIELPELGGRSKLGDLPLFVLVEKAGV